MTNVLVLGSEGMLGHMLLAALRQVNGWRVEGEGVEVVAGYGRDHDRHLGAGTFVARSAQTRVVMHSILGMHSVLHRRFLYNALRYLAA